MNTEKTNELVSCITKLKSHYKLSVAQIAEEIGVQRSNLATAMKGERNPEIFLPKVRELLVSYEQAGTSVHQAQQYSYLSVMVQMDADFKRGEQEQRRLSTLFKRAVRIIGPSLFQRMPWGGTSFDWIYREEIRQVGSREVAAIRIADRILYQRQYSYQHLTTGRNYQPSQRRQVSQSTQYRQVSQPQQQQQIAMHSTAHKNEGERRQALFESVNRR